MVKGTRKTLVGKYEERRRNASHTSTRMWCQTKLCLKCMLNWMRAKEKKITTENCITRWEQKTETLFSNLILFIEMFQLCLFPPKKSQKVLLGLFAPFAFVQLVQFHLVVIVVWIHLSLLKLFLFLFSLSLDDVVFCVFRVVEFFLPLAKLFTVCV